MNYDEFPLAFFITWTTYGTWLPGDERGWCKRGSRIVEPGDEDLRQTAHALMKQEPVILTPAQRTLVESVIDRHCEIRQWQLHARNARTNHIHAVISAALDGKEVRSQLKAWCSRRLSEQAGLKAKKDNGAFRWFSELGDVEWIDDQEHPENPVRYVNELQ